MSETANRRAKANTPPIDRFATHRQFADSIPAVKKAGGWPAVVALFVLWDRCNGKTGVVAMSVRRLAVAIGSERITARNALKALMGMKLIRPDLDPAGQPVPGRWKVHHQPKEQEAAGTTAHQRRRGV